MIGNQRFSSNHLCSVACKTSVKRFLFSKTFLFKNITCIYYACIAGCGKWEITGSFHQVGSGDQTQAFIYCTTLVPQRGYRALPALCPSLDCKVSNDTTESTPASPSPPLLCVCTALSMMLSDPHEPTELLHRARCPILILWLPLITPQNLFLNSPFQHLTVRGVPHQKCY